MSLSINYNAAAMSAQNYLNQSTAAENSSIQKLSSGYKINSASDDPAGYVISQKLQSQLGGLSQAINNSNDAINMVQTAEGAMNQTVALLQSMRSLAVHAANTGANDTASTAADQAQIKSALQELNTISTNTQFGTKNLLDGSAGTTVSNLDTNDFGGISAATSTPAGYMNVNVTSAASAAKITSSRAYAGGTTDTVNAAGTLTINGTNVTVGASDTVQNVMDNINSVSATTGVAATFNTVSNKVVLTQTALGSDHGIQFSESADILNGGNATSATGTNAVATVTYGDSTTETFSSGKGLQLVGNTSGTIINLKTNAVADYGTTHPNALLVTSGSLQFQIGAYAGQTASLTLGSVAANQLGTTATGLLGSETSVADINVTTANGAQDAIKLIDAAVAQVTSAQSTLGAFQTNVLQSNVNSLTTAQQNISASKSTITDTDMAAEMTNFTREQILAQAGTSMLGQANQTAQNILTLIKNG